MKKNILKTVIMATFTASVAGGLSGCVGSNAVTGHLMVFNVKAVDNRYARGGLNMLMAPAYALTVAADAIVFNSVEFWSGKNPINGKPHIVYSNGEKATLRGEKSGETITFYMDGEFVTTTTMDELVAYEESHA
jgi:hypothetical protein